MVRPERQSESRAAREASPSLHSAGKWAYAGEFAGRVAQPLVVLALARVLTPDDFGVVTAATIVVSFAQAFWEAGLAKALIQREATPAEVMEGASTVLWANLLLSLCLYGIVFVAATSIAGVFGDARVVTMVRVQALAIPVLALSSVPLALFQRELRFRPVFLSRLGAALAPGFVGLPLALMGAGYWSLVIGSIAGAVIQVVILFRSTKWRPNWTWSFARVQELARFAAWSAGEAVLSWSMLWLDAIVVGVSLTSHELGLFRTGTMAVMLVFGLAIGSMMPVLFAAFSRLQSEAGALHAAFAYAVRAIALGAMFLGALAVAAPEELSALVFGEQWREMGTVVQYLAIMHGMSWLVAVNVELYRAIGRPDLNTKVIAGCLLFYVPLLFWAGRQGLVAFLIVRLLVGAIGMCVHVLVVWKVAAFSPARFLRAVGWFVFAGVVAGAAGVFARELVPASDLLRAFGGVAASAAVFALLCIKERTFVSALAARLRQYPNHGANN